ncbi:hypothetical protein LO772_25895 [Yinghuangia sp. ASG 101]|uniref:hypothetical protein n=1 Tax=Yinghuangia sp. ASG 101 TaxID=2896848 RepID=UPI001E3B2CB5|nr:hypothetical protein [Yinghuangia sp. ASG 101]UGQ10275.1 hypothetical protein LO772_25895 [Yinghuangia sp. ASG 101]
MPSTEHEALVELLRDNPELIADTADIKHAVGDSWSARAASSDFTVTVPTVRHADAVLLYQAADATTPGLGVIVEVQRTRKAPKQHSWPLYVAVARERYACPIRLVVVCPKREIAKWASRPIDTGCHGWMLTPIVVGPDDVPVIDNVDVATRRQYEAILSALMHAEDAELRPRIYEALVAALYSLPEQTARHYTDIVYSAADEDARQEFKEALMTVTDPRFQPSLVEQFVDEGRVQGKAEGRAEGKADAVLLFLTTREIPVAPDAEARIRSCDDLDVLDELIRRATMAPDVDALFDGLDV